MRRGARDVRIPNDATLVLAVSGGPDSMALLHGAAHLAEADGLDWHLVVAHLDHGLRPESADDAQFVVRAAGVLGLEVRIARTDVAAAARDERISIEEAGRLARYRFLREVALPRGALIATGHTADDAAETVLINLLRGSGLAGTRGIPARRDGVVRPLLASRRAELRALLDRAGIPFLDDASNADPAYLRNRVRAELLPRLEELRPGSIDAIGRFSRLAADDDELLDTLARDELLRRTDDAVVDWHAPPPRALGRRILRLAIGDPAPSAERIEALLDAAEGSRGGLVVELGGGRRASVRERHIRIE